MPVSIGIAPSKTLAKLASDRGKKDLSLGGALAILDKTTATKQLVSTQIKDVWGVGRRLAPKLRGEGIVNAYDLAQLRPQRAQQLMGIKGRQLVAELNGTTCHQLELEDQKPQSISRTRTFGQDTHNLAVIQSAIATFAAQAAFRLRRSGQATKRAQVFAASNRNKPDYRQIAKEIVYHAPTADTGRLTGDLVNAFSENFNSKIYYHRAGVLLYDFVPADSLQLDLLGTANVRQYQKSARLMRAMDVLNERYGKNSLHYAAQDLGNSWQPQLQNRSPRYTTNINEIPKIHFLK